MSGERGTDFYMVGGVLAPGAAGYVERAVDDELFDHVLEGRFCHVLAPRQMGKSS